MWVLTTKTSSNFEFIPNEEQYQNSNIYKFMKKHTISSLEELSEKSKTNLEWFWESVEKDIGIVWDTPYTKTLDTSNGIPWTNGLLRERQISINHL